MLEIFLISLCVYVCNIIVSCEFEYDLLVRSKMGAISFFSHLSRFKTITAERNVEGTNLWLRDHSIQVEFVYDMDQFSSSKMAEIIFNSFKNSNRLSDLCLNFLFYQADNNNFGFYVNVSNTKVDFFFENNAENIFIKVTA